jgi:hypothetical protein
MSLNKSEKRKKKVIEQNRKLRELGLAPLTDPGPWYPIQTRLQFAPDFFRGLTDQETGIDTPPAK